MPGCFPFFKKNKNKETRTPTTQQKGMQKAFSISSLEPLKGIKIVKLLGSGNFGQVFLGDWDGTKVALKKLTDENIAEFNKEAAMLCQLRHPHIVAFLGISEEGEDKYMVCEYMSRGSLQDILRCKRFQFSPLRLLKMAIDAAKGMVYLESRKIVHRDLSVRNMLMDSKMNVKVSDFGLARPQSDSTLYTADTKLPVRWSAPETLMHGRSDSKSDVYSFGIVMWEIFELGKFPWWQCSNSEVIDTVCKGQEFLPQPDLCPDSLYRLMLSCWSMSSEQRPTFKKILEKLKEIKKEVLPLCDEGAASDMDFDFDVSLTVSRLMLQRSARDEELAEKSMRQTLYSMSPSPSFINNSEISSSS